MSTTTPIPQPINLPAWDVSLPAIPIWRDADLYAALPLPFADKAEDD